MNYQDISVFLQPLGTVSGFFHSIRNELSSLTIKECPWKSDRKKTSCITQPAMCRN